MRLQRRTGVGALAGSTGTALLGLGAVSWGCSVEPEPPTFLVLEDFAQAGAREVRLDEELTLHFDAELDPSSVHSASIAVLGEDGRRVDGSFQIDGRQLRFLPELPRSRELLDGGFRPGERLSVELTGFPALACLRSREGAVLQRPFRSQFETIPPGAPDGLFLDTQQGPREPFALMSLQLGPETPLRLVAAEALDPRSIDSGAFQLASAPAASGEASVQLVTIELRAELVENRPDRAVIELQALSGEQGSAPRFLEPGEYFLAVVDDQRLPRDLSGGPVEPSWGLGRAEVSVVERALPSSVGGRTFDFLDAESRSERSLPGAVGAAHWDETGTVRVRLPAAVGSGSAGVMRLGAGESGMSGELSAVRLEVPRGVEVELASTPGLVRLGAQGQIDISGQLRRRALSGPLVRGAGESFSAWRARLLSGSDGELPDLGLDRDQTLSGWLADAGSSGLTATVLIAGGDLLITGGIDVDGPLLLIAGGRVRITGSVQASEVWWSQPSLEAVGALELPLSIDEPLLNPLREAQTWRVSSEPYDPPREFAEWSGAWVSGRAGKGRYKVRYAQHFSAVAEPSGPQGLQLLEDPMFLESAAPIVFEIELSVPSGPGEPWDPPSIDRIDLNWKRRP